MKKIKLGVSYNVFNGEELLEASIKSIRNEVDYINVVWQEYSWTNEKANPKLVTILMELVKKGLVDEIIKFEFNHRKGSNIAKLRCKKENLGLRNLRKNGCTHFMMMDADEFYFSEEFQKAKNFVLSNNITHSACSIYDYRILPCYRMKDIRDYSVAFICKFTLFSTVIAHERINNNPCKIDSFRTVPFIPLVHKFYYLTNVSMQHMTGIRVDYSNKLRNSISNYSENGKKAILEYSNLQKRMEIMSEKEILDMGYIKVNDRFELMQLFNQHLLEKSNTF